MVVETGLPTCLPLRSPHQSPGGGCSLRGIMSVMDVATLLDIVPGSRVMDGFEIPDDLDAPFPTPYGISPPAEWFTEPHHDVLPGASALITADGRFCAYSHEWDRCHVSFTSAGECWTPPRSASGNRMFHQSRVITEEGVEIPTGVIPFGDGHAPLDATVAEAQQHYDRPERVTVWARAVETDDGCVLCGTIVPGTTQRQVALMRASALSGDWRWVPQLQNLDFLGPCFVARPGLPIGLEHAAIEQALYEIQRETEITRTAGGQITAVVGNVAYWEPRPVVTQNVAAPVLAAAIPTIGGPPVSGPCSCSTKTKTAQAGLPPGAQLARYNRRRGVTAAAGTALTYRELNDVVNDAVISAFGGNSDDRWVWVKDWDDTWAVFEVEGYEPIIGDDGLQIYQVSIAIQPDGTVVVARDSVVQVETIYAPVSSQQGPAPEPAGPVAAVEVDGSEPEMPMVAHASDTAAIAALSGQLSEALVTIDELSADVARLTAETLEPAEVVAELPEAPDPV